MIKKFLFGLLAFVLLSSFCSAYDFVSCNGLNNSSSQCIKLNNGESVSVSGYLYSFKGSNITTFNGSNTFNGLYSKAPFYYQRVRVFYESGSFFNLVSRDDRSLYKWGSGYSCISSDFNACMWNNNGFSTIYSVRDLSSYYGFDYDYVILPFSSLSSNVANGYGVCFHFPEFDNYLCLPAVFGYAVGEHFYDSWFDITSSLFNNPILGVNFPFGFSNGSIGSITGNINTNISGSTVNYECTWRDIFILLDSEGYNKNICYGGLDNFDLFDSSITYNPLPGQGLSLSQIWAWSGSRAWDNFNDWFLFWNGLYVDTEVSGRDYSSMWESYPAVYHTYFQIYNTYKNGSLAPYYLLNYCQSLDVITGNLLDTTVGGEFKPLCENIVREKQTGVWDERVDGSIYSEGVYTGNVPLSVNWGTGKTYSDGSIFIQDFYNKISSNLISDNGSTPIIPSYILLFLFAVILFKFLRK